MKKIFLEHNFTSGGPILKVVCIICGINKFHYYLFDNMKTKCLTEEEKDIKDIIE